MKITRRIIFAFIISTLAGVLLFLYLCYSVNGYIGLTGSTLKHCLFSLVVANAVGLGFYYLSQFLNKKAPWHLATAVRFAVELAVMGLCSFLICFAFLRLYLSWQGITPADFTEQYHDPLIKFVILVVVILFIYTIVDFTLYSYNQYAAIQIEEVKIASTQLALQFEVLKSQLSPHYLFNSLNTISSLIYSNPDQAEEFIRKLALTYQYILANQDLPLVRLSEELNFIKAYFFLLKSRFDNAVQLSVELPRRVLSSKIPPLTLQLLLENAVKHNAPSEENPLHIRIFVSDKNLLTISNNLLERNFKPSSFRVGLDNIRQRYHYFAKADIQVNKTDAFKIELPLIYAT
jgi:two-component system, LytTR family, sensor kinase